MPKKDAIIRTVILAITLLNNILTVFSINPLPFSDNQIYEVISVILTVGASIWTWWKNNSFTKKAIEADEYLLELKKSSTTTE